MCSNRSSLHIQTWSFIAPQDALYLFALPQGVSSSTLDSDLTVKAKEASFCMIEKTALCLACIQYIRNIYIPATTTTYTFYQHAQTCGIPWSRVKSSQVIVQRVKSVQVMVCLHIFPIFSFLAKMLSSLSRYDNIFARNENIGKIYKRTIT